MGDITEYIQTLKDFKNGFCEYETVQRKQDVKIAHKVGKMFVFTRNRTGEKFFILVGLMLISIGLIISLFVMNIFSDLSTKILVFIMFMSFFGGIGAILVVLNFLKLLLLHKSFMVIGPKGMVKSSIFGVIRAYPWKDVHVSAFTVKTTIRRFGIVPEIWTDLKKEVELPPYTEVYVKTPKGRNLTISPGKYVLKEFFDLEKFKDKLKSQQIPKLSKDERFHLKIRRSETEKYSIALFVLTFKYYFEMGKFGTSFLI